MPLMNDTRENRQGGTRGKPTWWQRLVQRLVTQAAASRFLSQFVHHVDRWTFKLTKGGASLSGVLTGWPVLILTTTGAKSGQRRTVPLVGIPSGNNVILIASNYGRSRSPAWYYNLKANPKAEVTRQGITSAYIAREAAGKERLRYWNAAVEVFSGYEAYRRRAADRHIPVMVLEPVVD